MQLRQLHLMTKPGNWQRFTARKRDKAFHALRDKTLARDHYTCQFCGFQARDYQEIVNLDHNYRNNRSDNLVTACAFCSQCSFIESVGVGGYGGGVLVYLPEIEQSQLCAFCHVLFCAIANGTNYKDSAMRIYRDYKFRAQVVEEHYGEGSSKPALFGRMLLSHQQSNDELVTDLLKDLRLLPSHTRFRKQIDAWAKAALEEMPGT